MPADIRVIDDFLPEDLFKEVKDLFYHPETTWYLAPGISDMDSTMDQFNPLDNWYLVHVVYNSHEPKSNAWERMSNIFIPALKERVGIEFQQLTRIKANCYPHTHEVQEHPFHVDSIDQHSLKGALYSLNTCDGYTGFADETKVDSVANRMIIFDSTKKHHSTSTSNAPQRININFNFL